MKVSASRRDRLIGKLIWGAAISCSVMMSGAFTTRPADANPCCRYDRSEVLFAPPPPASEDYTLSLASIDPSYVLTKVLVPIIYASLILRIIWLIQRK